MANGTKTQGNQGPFVVKYTTGKDALTEEEVTRLLSVTDRLEDEVLLLTAIETGIRREDIVAIETNNLKFFEDDQGLTCAITFWESKRKRHWKTFIGNAASIKLKQWLNIVEGFRLYNKKYVFQPRKKGCDHMSGKTAYNILRRRLKQAGIRHRPFHSLRATCVKTAQKKGWTIEQVMGQTGDSWETISEHYSTPTEEEMRNLVKQKSLLTGDKQ